MHNDGGRWHETHKTTTEIRAQTPQRAADGERQREAEKWKMLTKRKIWNLKPNENEQKRRQQSKIETK